MKMEILKTFTFNVFSFQKPINLNYKTSEIKNQQGGGGNSYIFLET